MATDNKQYICTSCGHIGTPHYTVKGSVLIEIVLWLCFLIPGLIYSIWRMTSGKRWVCSACNNDALIPLNTPMGQQLQNSLGKNQSKVIDQEKALSQNKEGKPNYLLIGFGAVVLLIFFSILSTTSNNYRKQELIKLGLNPTPTSTVTFIKQGTLLGKYNYTTGKSTSEDKYFTTFEPFLTQKDILLAIPMIMTDIYGKHIVNEGYKQVERNGLIYYEFTGPNGSYLVLPIKEDTGETNSLVFWKE